jgi:aminomethyltransferase
VTSSPGERPTEGAAVSADGEVIGSVHLVTALAGCDQQLALALLDKPFDVPGLELRSTGPGGGEITLRSVASPVLIPRSWGESVGQPL